LASYQGASFLEHLLNVARHPEVGVRRVVLGPDADAISRQVALPPGDVVLNKDWERGPLSSIHAALRSLPAGTEGMLLCPVDHPLVSAMLVNALIATFLETRAPVVLPVFEGRRGHPVIFSAAVYKELLGAPMETGARAVVWAHENEVREVSTSEEGCVLNLNDPDAILRAKNK